MEYVSPIDDRTQDAVAFAARDGDLSGKRVVLVDITKARRRSGSPRRSSRARRRGR